jgi:TATA-binding protein-associated factor
MLHGLSGVLWNWNHWQELTGITHGLFPDDDRHLPAGWTRVNALDVKSYFTEYNALATEELKMKFSKSCKRT